LSAAAADMISRCFRLVFAVLIGAQISGCALLRRHPKKKPEKPAAPLLVGTITLVNDDGHFVLIDSGMSPSPAPGAVLKCRTAGGESGELKAGAIRKRPFAIADVVKGTPHVGDQVFQEPP
jgi:hypothetical protein